MLTTRRLAVWGDPIDHSRSPDLHAAAYRALGLEWEYGRAQVSEAGFEAEIAALGPQWVGLSLTMPLKRVAYLHAVRRDRPARLTGAVNTYLLGPHGPHGFNTDVGGLANDLRARGFAGIDRARIIGAGATATSALVSLAELGATRVLVAARRPEAVGNLWKLGHELGVTIEGASIDAPGEETVPLTVAALPGSAELAPASAARLATLGGSLADVVYGQWPSALGRAWDAIGSPAWGGLGMLLHQALLQVRIFTEGAPDAELRDEQAVFRAMREAMAPDTDTLPNMGD